ncbi:MAG: hypothetical protein ACJ79K_17825 [Gemmatimonadaceae bacterium]
MRLIHDVLDMQLVDRTGQKMGRVDGIVLEIRDDQPPRVAELLVGGSVASERIGRWMVALARLVTKLLSAAPAVTRIPFAQVRAIGPCVEVDLDASATNTMRTERWLGDHIVSRIPGGSGEERK